MFHAAMQGFPNPPPGQRRVNIEIPTASTRARGAHPRIARMEATRVIAVRHGETAWNVDTRIQGQLDIDLNDTGAWQARRVGAGAGRRAVSPPSTPATSPRAWQTAQADRRRPHGIEVNAEPGLRERAFGHFEGTHLRRDPTPNCPNRRDLWRTRDPGFAPEGGESLLDLPRTRDRHRGRLAARHPGEQVVLVAHGGVMDVLYRAATAPGTAGAAHLAAGQRRDQPPALDAARASRWSAGPTPPTLHGDAVGRSNRLNQPENSTQT